MVVLICGSNVLPSGVDHLQLTFEMSSFTALLYKLNIKQMKCKTLSDIDAARIGNTAGAYVDRKSARANDYNYVRIMRMLG